jgi:Domain of unknown function (DUF4157)
MFAPKVAKAQTKAAANPRSTLVPQRPAPAGHRPGHGPVEQALFLQRTIGNQATLRLLARQTSGPVVSNPPSKYEQEGGATEYTTARETSRSASWDFSKIPIFSPDQPTRLRTPFPVTAPPLRNAIQTKLMVGRLDDPLEHEADRVADQVTMPSVGASAAASPPQISRKCPAYEGKQRLQANPAKPQAVFGEAPESVHEVLRSPGQPLDAATREFFEPRFGHNLDHVRVHTDARAAQSAQAIGAKAYTAGREVVFGQGQFSPHSNEGRRLLAHELTHVAQAASPEQCPARAAGHVRRTVIFTANNPISYEFKMGVDLTEQFTKEAKRLVADGTLSDPEIIKLKAEAVKDRGTVSDSERVFMAGLLDSANIATLKRTAIGPQTTFAFPLASITTDRIAHIIDVDRMSFPASLATPLGDVGKALASVNLANVQSSISKADAAATTEITAQAGSTFATQGRALLGFLATNAISPLFTLQAMIAAASDNDPADRLFAGVVYAVATQAGNPMAFDILAGKIKIDALSPTSFARLAGISFQNALYVAAAPINPAQSGFKGDTMYIETDLNIENVKDRAVIIHELKHASDDKAASATGRVTSPVQQFLELAAYEEQARYILDQMSTQSASDQVQMAKDAISPVNDGILLGGLIVGKSDPRKYQPLLERLFDAVPTTNPSHQNAAGVARLLGFPKSQLEHVLLDAIRQTYGITATTTTILEGQAGESVIHWINRLMP